MLRSTLSILMLCLSLGCAGSGGGDDDDDMTMTPPPPDEMNLCGIGPGAAGNSMGVGKYCDGFGDCSGQTASICATAGDPDAHFCTTVCDPNDTSGTACGDQGAACACQGSQCGCVPASCGQ